MSIPRFNISALKQAIERQQSEMKKDIFRSVVMDIWANERKVQDKSGVKTPLKPGSVRIKLTISPDPQYENRVMFFDLDDIQFEYEYWDEPYKWNGELKYKNMNYDQFIQKYQSRLVNWFKKYLDFQAKYCNFKCSYCEGTFDKDVITRVLSKKYNRETKELTFIIDFDLKETVSSSGWSFENDKDIDYRDELIVNATQFGLVPRFTFEDLELDEHPKEFKQLNASIYSFVYGHNIDYGCIYGIAINNDTIEENLDE
jgi:hypothetical protein